MPACSHQEFSAMQDVDVFRNFGVSGMCGLRKASQSHEHSHVQRRTNSLSSHFQLNAEYELMSPGGEEGAHCAEM